MNDSPIMALFLILATILAPAATEKLRSGSFPNPAGIWSQISALSPARRVAVYAAAGTALGTFLPWWTYDSWARSEGSTVGWWDATVWRLHGFQVLLEVTLLDPRFLFPLGVATAYLVLRGKIEIAISCAIVSLVVAANAYESIMSTSVIDGGIATENSEYIHMAWGFYLTVLASLVLVSALYVALVPEHPNLPHWWGTLNRGVPPQKGEEMVAVDADNDLKAP